MVLPSEDKESFSLNHVRDRRQPSALNHVVPPELNIENIVVTLTKIVPKDGGVQFGEWL
jgi:hypothetical protein